MSYSTGCGVISKRITSAIFSSMKESIWSSSNTPPAFRNPRSLSSDCSASRSEPQTVGIFFSSFGGSRRDPCPSLAGVDLVLDAVEAGHQEGREGEIGFAPGSGKRISTRLAFGFDPKGMRQEAERLRAE